MIFDGGYTLGQRLGSSNTLVVTRVPMPPTVELRATTSPLEIASAQPQAPKRSWMQEMFNYPGGGDITGSVATTKPAEKEAAEKLEGGKKAARCSRAVGRRAKGGRGKGDCDGAAAVGVAGGTGAARTPPGAPRGA